MAVNILFGITLIKGINTLVSQIAQTQDISSTIEVFDTALEIVSSTDGSDQLSFLPSLETVTELLGEEVVQEEIAWIRENLIIPFDHFVKEAAQKNRHRLSLCAQVDLWVESWHTPFWMLDWPIARLIRERYANAEIEEITDLQGALAGMAFTLLVYASADLQT